MINVLYICNFESPYRIDFWNELTKYCNVTVLFTETKEQQAKGQNRDLKWFKSNNYLFESALLRQLKLPFHKHICLDVRKYVLSRKFDIIVFHPYSPLSCVYGIFLCITHRIPYMISSDGGFAKSGKGLKEKFKCFLISHAEGVLSTARATDEYLMFYGVKRDNIYRYTLTSIKRSDILEKEITKDDKKNIRKQLGIEGDRIIISVGRIIPIKAFDTLVKVMSKFREDYSLYIIGGTENDELRKIREDNNISNIHYVDFVGKKELSEYYRAADVFVMTTRGDTWGLVINEALANGLPVISSNKCIAATELVKDGFNGYIFEVDDIEALEKAIIQFFEEGTKMSRNALESIQKITIEEMASNHRHIFEKVLRKREELE